MADDPQVEIIRPVAQAMGLPDDYVFDSTKVPEVSHLARLSAIRATEPEVIDKALADRPRRKKLSDDGRLVILAADHPARMVTSVGTDRVRMGNRADYLGRIIRVLAASDVDGLMATPDIIDDVVTLDALERRAGGEGFLGKRLLIGSMNRTGLQNAAHELWDPPAAYLSVDDLRVANLDGAKILWRYTPTGDESKECQETMVAMARLVAEAVKAKMPMFIEPLVVESKFEKWVLSKVEEDWIRMVGVASSLGPSTARSWLKIPFVRPFNRIVAATTLPILMLGGPATGFPASTLVDFDEGMAAGLNVFGALVGRNILYPGADDPAVMARAVCHIVHDRMSAGDAARKAGQADRL
jgi:DhnA family fructose-bisphosphate aldolase class Ia